MKAFDAFIKVVSAVFETFTRLLLAVMVVVIMWLVISRQVLGRASSWAEEISLVMIIWFGLIGATFGVRDRYHLRLDLFFRALPRPARSALAFATEWLVIAFGAMLVYGGAQLVALTREQTLPATKLSGALRYMPLPVSGVLIILFGLHNLLSGNTAADADPAPEAIPHSEERN